MTDDQETPERFTDSETAFLRHVRFGELPPRPSPQELVALTETDDKRDLPEAIGDPQDWRLRNTGG